MSIYEMSAYSSSANTGSHTWYTSSSTSTGVTTTKIIYITEPMVTSVRRHEIEDFLGMQVDLRLLDNVIDDLRTVFDVSVLWRMEITISLSYSYNKNIGVMTKQRFINAIAEAYYEEQMK